MAVGWALIAPWFGGEHFYLRQVRALYNAAQRLAGGDWSTRTGLKEAEGELGQLAKTFDLWPSRCNSGLRTGGSGKKPVERTFQQTWSPHSDNSR